MRALMILFIGFCLPFITGVVSQEDLNREHPCESRVVIGLPQDKKCLVPVRTAYNWTTAASTCERLGGSLFRAPDSLLASRPELTRCLSSMKDLKADDMWINAFGVWSPHFIWTNRSSVNQVDYCTYNIIPTEPSSTVQNGRNLSVDYCVMTCKDRGSQYTVYLNNSVNFDCYCSYSLDASVTREKCAETSVDTSAARKYYIMQAKEDSLINVISSAVPTRTESLCTTVDSNTFGSKRISSEMCFTGHNFLCDVGDESKCTSTACVGVECYYIVRQRCLVRVALNYNWWAGRAYCNKLGGDLWDMYKLVDLTQIAMVGTPLTKYWIGATNYDWKFNATSARLLNVPVNVYSWYRCGHMYKVTSPGALPYWEWGGADCQQQKAFLCEFTKTTFTQAEIDNQVSCPVPLDPNIPGTTPPGGVVTNGPQIGQASSGSDEDDSILAPLIIAAIIALLILLTCLALAFLFCCRREWMPHRFRKVRDHLTFVPYLADVSGGDYDSHANMSSVSDHGSQIGLIKSGYHNNTSGYGLSTSYGEQSGVFSSKSLDRRHKETIDRKLADSKSYLASGNSSMDERGFATTYNTLPSRPRDLMTLQAQMDIKDEMELADMRGSLRNKPEVALVTDNVDMNFTVNHAVSRFNSHPGSEMSPSSLERTMEEITLPASEGRTGLNLPERIAEESRLHSTMTRNYHGL